MCITATPQMHRLVKSHFFILFFINMVCLKHRSERLEVLTAAVLKIQDF